LVAAELEQHWELALQAVEDARDAAERFRRQSPPGLSPQMQAGYPRKAGQGGVGHVR